MDAVKTYRYLRLALIGMAVLIAAAVLHEWWATGWRCVQPSLSSYYFTPARGALVGALLAIGVLLVVVKGSTDWEDVLLNIGGASAPVVAFVPTADTGGCRSVTVQVGGTAPDVANNVFALLVLGALTLAVTVLVVLRSRRVDRPSRASDVIGIVAAGVLYVAALVVFVGARGVFVRHAHYAAAAVLFLCMVAVVTINAWSVGRQRAGGGALAARDYANAYAVVAVAMVASVVLMVAWRAIFGWAHAVLAIEIVLVVSFATFWAIQTRELWHAGLRGISGTPTPDER